MNQKTILSIKKPCSQTFNNFLSTDKGGFCNSCQKEVIDFRNKTDSDIANHFNNATQNTCGYFNEDQLRSYKNEELSGKKNNNNFWRVGLAAASILSLFPFNKTFSQSKEQTTTIQTEDKNNESDIENTEKQNHIEGVVFDENHYPILGVSVVIKNTNNIATTDFDGRFSLDAPLQNNTVLRFSYIGCKPLEIVVSENKPLEIVLREEKYELMGEVSVDRIYHSKPTFFQRIKLWFRNV